MHLRRLRIENLRVIEQLEVELAPGWNLFTGDNGAGKTSMVEAAFLLSHGRSFRTGIREALVRVGCNGYSIFGELVKAGGETRRVGIARSSGRIEAKLDGQGVTAAELMHHAAVLCFEPGSHDLISGPADERRRFLDWGVFHVEHGYLTYWRRYHRALKQRNAALRNGGGDSELDVWDRELACAAEVLTAMRQRYVDALRPVLSDVLVGLLGELGQPEFAFLPGYDSSQSLDAVLLSRRDRDRLRGHTGSGPHRADWGLSFEGAPRREHLSRGQEKLCAFACVLAQATLFFRTAGEWPVICVDDLASEVDRGHQTRLLALLAQTNAQILVTGTEAPAALAETAGAVAMFHVEQGRVSALL